MVDRSLTLLCLLVQAVKLHPLMQIPESLILLRGRPISKHGWPVWPTHCQSCFSTVDFRLTSGLSTLLQSPWVKLPLFIQALVWFLPWHEPFSDCRVRGEAEGCIEEKNAREKNGRAHRTRSRQWPLMSPLLRKTNSAPKTHTFKAKSSRFCKKPSYLCLAFSIS